MSNVHDFGAKGDGVQDDTSAIQHACEQGNGRIEFSRGQYLVTKTILVDTTRFGRLAISGSGGTAKIIMRGAGPALHVIGNHAGTADPSTMHADVWKSQRLPTVDGIEIEGRHKDADGIRLTGTVQAIVKNVGLHALRNGLLLTNRNRNTIVEGCQIYHNTGVGIFFDGVNLHQINLTGNHISYNRLGGIRIERSEVRNLQITGNDIEYNNNRAHGIQDEITAEIHIDATAPHATVNEVTIASNTIQATPSPEGANIRIVEDSKTSGRPPGLYTITGNVIGSQTNNVHLTGCYGMTITGNCIYSAVKRNLLLENCRQVIIGTNQFRRHTPDMDTGVLLQDSSDCILSGCHVLDESETDSEISLLQLSRCQRISVNGCQFITEARHCLFAEDCRDVVLSGSTFSNQADKHGKAAIHWQGDGRGNLLTGCHIQPASPKALNIADSAGLKLMANLHDA